MRGTSSLLHLQDVGLKLHYKTTLLQLFPKSLAKLAYQPVVYGIGKNLIIETFAYFINIYILLIFVYISNFWNTFPGNTSNGCFSLYVSECCTRKSEVKF